MLKKNKLNKRGDLSDVFVFLLISVFLAISFIVVLFVNDKLVDVITETPLNDTSVSSNIVSAFNTINSITVQRGYALFMGILIIGIIVSAFLVRLHPAFIFLYIIMLAFSIFIAVYLGNLYESFISTEGISAIAANQSIITFFMQNIVKITIAVGALSMIIIFSKIFGGGGGLPDI